MLIFSCRFFVVVYSSVVDHFAGKFWPVIFFIAIQLLHFLYYLLCSFFDWGAKEWKVNIGIMHIFIMLLLKHFIIFIVATLLLSSHYRSGLSCVLWAVVNQPIAYHIPLHLHQRLPHTIMFLVSTFLQTDSRSPCFVFRY